MKNFTKKAKLIERLREDLDSHIWSIFSRYIKEERINFNYPDDWQIDGDSIFFYGQDGCMGCYDPMHLSIPMKFFEDPEAAFAERAEEREKEKQEKKEKARLIQEERERKELTRLKEKYDE